MGMVDVHELVTAARTYRRFDERAEVPGDLLRRWVDCARLAPCAQNRQALRYAIVDGPRTCAAVFASLKWAAALPDWVGPEPGERPRAYVVICAEGVGPLTPMDVGIAAQTIKLAAQADGFGSCMFKSYARDGIARAIGLDASRYDVQLVMAFGRPAERVVVEPMGEDANVFDYWRDDAGVHHVPKRSLADVLIETPAD